MAMVYRGHAVRGASGDVPGVKNYESQKYNSAERGYASHKGFHHLCQTAIYQVSSLTGLFTNNSFGGGCSDGPPYFLPIRY